MYLLCINWILYVRVDFHSVIFTGLQNDHKSIMKLIEEKIHQLHEEARRHRVASEGKQIVKFVIALVVMYVNRPG